MNFLRLLSLFDLLLTGRKHLNHIQI